MKKVIIYVIIFAFFYLIGWAVDKGMDSKLYEPRCWVKQDVEGVQKSTGKEAVKQLPFDCSDFK